MKPLMPIFLALLAALNAPAFAGYVIEEKMEHTDAPAQEVIIKLKEGKARCDLGTVMSTIYDGREIKMLMHSGKQAMTLPSAAVTPKRKAVQSSEGARLQATGRKENINGFETEEYVHDNPTLKAKGHYWIAKDVADGAEILKLMENLQNPAAKQMAQSLGSVAPEAFPGIPIRTEIESNLMGKPSKTIVTITSIKKGPIDDSAFVVPADYRPVGPGHKGEE